ncbi:hypothetical protein IAU59_003753 [Kwoniella sp. CBS 9459]
MDSPPPELPALNMEDVLDLRFSVSADAIETTNQYVRALKDHMDPYMEIYMGKVEKHPIWDKWEKEARGILQLMPRPKRLPIVHRFLPSPEFQAPAVYGDISGLNGTHHIGDDSFNDSRHRHDESETTHVVYSPTGQPLHEAYDLSNLDRLDGAPFLPLTPSSTSRSSAATRHIDMPQPGYPKGAVTISPSNDQYRGWAGDRKSGISEAGKDDHEPRSYDAMDDIDHRDSHFHMDSSPSISRPLQLSNFGSSYERSSGGPYHQDRPRQTSPQFNLHSLDRWSNSIMHHADDQRYVSDTLGTHKISFSPRSPLRSDADVWNQPTVRPAQVFAPHHEEVVSADTSAEWQTPTSVQDAVHGQRSYERNTARSSVQHQYNPEPLFLPGHLSDSGDKELDRSQIPRQATTSNHALEASTAPGKAPSLAITPASEFPRWIPWHSVEADEGVEIAKEAKRESKPKVEQQVLKDGEEEVDELYTEEYSHPLVSWPTGPGKAVRTNRPSRQTEPKLDPRDKVASDGQDEDRSTKKAKCRRKSRKELSFEDLIMTIDPNTIGKKPARTEEKRSMATNLSQSQGSLASVNASALVADPRTLEGFLVIRGHGDLADRDKPSSQLRELYPVQEEEPEDWRSNTDIQNPKWYIKSASTTTHPQSSSFLILVAATVLQNIPLVRAMREAGFDLVERENRMEETDIALSASTAVVIHDFSTLGYTRDKLFQDLKAAAGYYKRVILILEIKPVTSTDNTGGITKGEGKDISPLTDDALRGLKTLKKAYNYAFKSTKSIIGDLEIVYAYNGAAEVAKAINHLAREEGKQAASQLEQGHWEEMWGHRNWLRSVQPENWQIGDLIHHFALNSFCAIYAFYRSNGNVEAIEHMSDRERTAEFAPVFGPVIMDRFNSLMRQKEWLLKSKSMLLQDVE